jgi:hypothetical protein
MRPDAISPCPTQGLSTVHPADVKEKRTAQRAFQKTQWAALDASMASNSKRRAREAEQEASRHASLAAQAAKARAKEIKRRESSGLYKLAPEFRAQQQVEAEPAANELGGQPAERVDGGGARGVGFPSQAGARGVGVPSQAGAQRRRGRLRRGPADGRRRRLFAGGRRTVGAGE